MPGVVPGAREETAPPAVAGTLCAHSVASVSRRAYEASGLDASAARVKGCHLGEVL